MKATNAITDEELVHGKTGKGTQHVFGWVVANRVWIPYFDG